MASSSTSCLTPSSSSSSWILTQKFHKCPTDSLSFCLLTRFSHSNQSRLLSISKSQPSASSSSSSSLSYSGESRNRPRVSVVLGAIDGEEISTEEHSENVDNVSGKELKKLSRPCELYVCNLPRSFDIADLVELFKPFGTVLSAEILRNVETGISRGCGYVTMGSINSAKIATASLDGSDVGGRELRIRFSVDMNLPRRNLNTLSSSPKKNIIYESPHKVYVGNLEWSVKPGDLRNLFSQFGIVVSVKVLHDQRANKNRVYGFLSYSSAAERDAAIVLDGTEFRGRKLVVKLGSERTET